MNVQSGRKGKKNNQHTIDIIPFYIDTMQGINNISFENMKRARNAFSEDSLVFYSCPHNYYIDLSYCLCLCHSCKSSSVACFKVYKVQKINHKSSIVLITQTFLLRIFIDDSLELRILIPKNSIWWPSFT